MMYTGNSLISSVVNADFRSAAVFQRYGVDFCCGGGRPILDACRAKGIDESDLLGELNSLSADRTGSTPRFDQWEPDMLADYIVANHHQYVREVLPAIGTHAEKVARVHGENHPELVRIAELVERVSRDLVSHMEREEGVLFPYINTLAVSSRNGTLVAPPRFGSVENPIRMMEQEHQQAGDELAEIRTLSSEYTPPMDACATYRVLFQELEAFEDDLHIHVHLENNILFPKAKKLEQELMQPA